MEQASRLYGKGDDGMSVLIKNMEVPQKCGQCKLFHAEQPMYCIVDKNYRTVGAPYGMPRPDWCPLTELPPHGRLIDADELKSKFRHGNGDDDADSAWISTIRRFITQADTIIEAEGTE